MRYTIKKPAEMIRERNLGAGQAAQMYAAQSAIRRMRKYTPQDTHTMANSAMAIEGGAKVRQQTPYARRQYYETGYRHRGIQTHHWFEAMKQNGGAQAILREVARQCGAKEG